MKITYLDLYRKRSWLQNVNGVTNKISYWKMKNFDKILSEIRILESAHPILKTYVEFEQEQNKIQNSIEDVEEKKQKLTELFERHKETIECVNSLMIEEVDIEFYKIHIDMLIDDSISKEIREVTIFTLKEMISD